MPPVSLAREVRIFARKPSLPTGSSSSSPSKLQHCIKGTGYRLPFKRLTKLLTLPAATTHQGYSYRLQKHKASSQND
eukprot:1159369-Pelagomonas_calceolata.AAC.6